MLKSIKANYKLLIKILLITATVLTSVLLVSTLFLKPKGVSAQILSPTEANVKFLAGITTRSATAYNNGKFTYYNTEKPYLNNIDNTITPNNFYMLNNYKQAQRLSTSLSENIENIYISFGNMFSNVMQSTTYGGNGYLLSHLTVHGYLNGKQIVLNEVKNENITIQQGLDKNYYFYDYLDLKDLKYQEGNTQVPVTNTEGFYSFNFNYQYIIKTGNEYKSVGHYDYEFGFYLIDQSTYATNYPTYFENNGNNVATLGTADSNSVLQYFYNFQSNNLPEIVYDASLYNVSYTRNKQQINETVTTSFKKLSETQGEITYTSNLSGVSTKLIGLTNGKFINSISYSELGTYELIVSYVVNINNNFVVVDNTQIPTYDVSYIQNDVNPFETGLYSKNNRKLHIFGVKAYYTQAGQKHWLGNNEISADITHLTLPTSVTSGLYNSITDNKPNVPTTNLPPITFDWFGTYSITNTIPQSKIYKYNNEFKSTPDSTQDFRKDSQISESGNYEVVFEYTFDLYSTTSGQSTTKHYQAFAFKIDNSTPTVSLNLSKDTIVGNNDDTSLGMKTHTNQNVYASWDTPTNFMLPRTATLIRTDFNGSNLTTTPLTLTHTTSGKTQTNLIEGNGRYSIKVFYSTSTNLSVEYSFIIDKTDIQNIDIKALNSFSTSNQESYSINTDVDLSNKLIINQPFTLTYSQKESGASITTKYVKIPFTSYNGGEYIDSNKNYISNNYEINHYASTGILEYHLDYNQINQGKVVYSNAFVDNSSSIYMFTITDEAGNSTTKYLIYDLTLPEVITTPPVNNKYNIISNETTLEWGTHKAVKVYNPDQDNTTITDPVINNLDFKDLIDKNPNYFTIANNSYYMIVPITKIEFEYFNTATSESSTRTLSPTSLNPIKSTTFYPVLPSGNVTDLQRFFSGNDKIFTYKIYDQSKIVSNSTIASTNQQLTGTIWINLDNSETILFGKNLDLPTSYSNIGEAIATGVTTNAHQLRVSYKPGTNGSDYEVKSFKFAYYEFEPSLYTNIASQLEDTSRFDLQNNEPIPSYPFKTTPTINYQDIRISSEQIDGYTDEENYKNVSEIINPSSEEGKIVTLPGMYVFRREYMREAITGSNENDPVVKYYVMYVDRDKIINIPGYQGDENYDVDIDKITNPTSNSILYSTGSGINFKFTSSLNDTTRYSALKIQQFLTYVEVGNINIFDSNKLPVKFILPYDKYNTKQVLSKASDYSNYTAEINRLATNNNFKMYYKISYKPSNDSASVLVLDTYNNNYFNSNFFGQVPTAELNTNLFNLMFKIEGIYSVQLYTAKPLMLEQNDITHLATTYSFDFSIIHESPIGAFYGEYADSNTDRKISEQSATTTNKMYFYSSRDNSLKFKFNDNPDMYKALIDANNLRVTRINKNKTSQETIFSIVNGVITPASDANVFTKETIDGLSYYTIDLNKYINQSAHKDFATYIVRLQFIGNEDDYKLDNGQKNYYYRDFEVIIDREKPVYNLNQLIAKDSQKYNANAINSFTTKQNFYNDYFFAIDSSFVFYSESINGYPSELESYELFLRKIDYENSIYYHSITPDEDTTSPSSSHLRFSESNSVYINKSIYNYENGKSLIKASDLFRGQTSGYYEVIERDQAGNYRVYAVQYNDNSNTKYDFEYILTGETATDVDGNLVKQSATIDKNNNNALEIKGNNLQLSQIDSTDYFLKAIISFDGKTIEIINNPNNNQIIINNTQNNITTSSVVENPNSVINKRNMDSFIQQINIVLNSTTTERTNGYNIKITFVNRFFENYQITYLIPGTVLMPVFENLTSITFKVSIPADADNGSTKIVRFKVWKFVNGEFGPNEEIFDYSKKPITTQANGQSLYPESYIFSTGEYKFTLEDNFGRSIDVYYGIGVNDVKEINYGANSKVLNNITYTAQPVVLKYQKNFYQLLVYKNGVLLSDKQTDSQISITQQASNIEMLTFNLLNDVKYSNYKIELLYKRADVVYTYEFVLFKQLPAIHITNLTDTEIKSSSSATEPTIHTEQFKLVWDTSYLLSTGVSQTYFNPRVELTRLYTDTDGRTKSETTTVSNGFIVSQQGTYTAKIINDLGYTDPSFNIYFKLVEGNVTVYNVVEITNNIENNINPSEIVSTINYNNKEKVLYQYYVNSKFKGGTATDLNYIEIRVDRNKGIDYEKLGPLYNISDNSIVYRLFGTGTGWERFIEIIFVDQQQANTNFTNLEIFTPSLLEDNSVIETPLNYSNEIKTTAQYIKLIWNSYNAIDISGKSYFGNTIYAKYSYNNDINNVQTIYSLEELQKNTLIFDKAGIYKISFRDLSGNVQTVNGYSEFTINLVNNLLFTVNGNEPIENFITNNTVVLKTTNHNLYLDDPVVEIKINGISVANPFTYYKNGAYEFTTHGYYEITLKATVSENNSNQQITTVYNFIIINKEQSVIAFNIPENYNFEVLSVIYKDVDITNQFGNLNELWLSEGATGMGRYLVSLSYYNSVNDTYSRFSFEIWINQDQPYITSSIEFGESTTKKITITYNPKTIYENVGAVKLMISGKPAITINSANSADSPVSVILDQKGTYWIQIVTEDGQVISSYKVIRNEPLNSNAIIIIIIVSIIVVGLVIVFIILRKHIKFR